ncbi:MAG: hypothetical protein EBQ49_01910 [Verrucomicrobia bacterium]|nr:hypothetical protein [Verrucomicrobiota bacterium]
MNSSKTILRSSKVLCNTPSKALKPPGETFSRYLLRLWIVRYSGAKSFDSVNGIEVSADAARKAAENATLNGLTNCRFIAGSAESIFKNIPVRGNESAVIVDPPRKGCDENFLEQLHKFSPRRIIYISCSPDTQARDLKYLCARGWKVVSANHSISSPKRATSSALPLWKRRKRNGALSRPMFESLN